MYSSYGSSGPKGRTLGYYSAGAPPTFPPSDLVSTVIACPLCSCLVKKISQGTDVFTHKHTELPASSLPCAVCSQARMYEINHIDHQFFISH